MAPYFRVSVRYGSSSNPGFPAVIPIMLSSGTPVTTAVVCEIGQSTSTRSMPVALPRPISCRAGDPPKLLTLPTAR